MSDKAARNRELHKQNFPRGIRGAYKAYRLMYDTNKAAVLLHFPGALIRAVMPYMGLFVTGYILNGFARGAEFMHLLQFALGYIGVRFLLERVEGYTEKRLRAASDTTVARMYLDKAKKYMHIDYELLDGPAITEINHRIARDNNWGAGFYNMPAYIRLTSEAFFGLLAGLGMMIPFFIHSGVGGVSLLLAALIGVGLLAAWINIRLVMPKFEALISAPPDPNQPPRYFPFFTYRFNISYLLKTARIYNAAPLINQRMDDYIPEENEFARKFTGYRATAVFVDGISGGVLLIGAYLFVVARAVAGVIPIGSVVMFAGAIHRLATQFFDFTRNSALLMDQTNKVQSMMAFMEMDNAQPQGTLPIEKRRDGEYDIEFRNVSFKYPGNENYALRDFNLKLHIGQKLAIVGMNGSGKTTMIKLLTRLYDPTEGQITLNGIDIRKYDLREYMQIFSVVFQDFKVFSFTLGDNIACDGAEEFDEEKAEQALSDVGLEARVAAMPKRLETYMYNNYDDGVEISGGEGQKIALARALYKKAPFIILDEPTAALDPIAEYEIYAMFNQTVADKTAVFISHRLSSCRFCDDIAVFHEGRLVQRGNHDVLVGDEKGKYHELWHAQAQYYAEEKNA